jgi:hypothetical protein
MVMLLPTKDSRGKMMINGALQDGDGPIRMLLVIREDQLVTRQAGLKVPSVIENEIGGVAMKVIVGYQLSALGGGKTIKTTENMTITENVDLKRAQITDAKSIITRIGIGARLVTHHLDVHEKIQMGALSHPRGPADLREMSTKEGTIAEHPRRLHRLHRLHLPTSHMYNL